MDQRSTSDLPALEQSKLRPSAQFRRAVEYRFSFWTLMTAVLIAVIAIKLLTSA